MSSLRVQGKSRILLPLIGQGEVVFDDVVAAKSFNAEQKIKSSLFSSTMQKETKNCRDGGMTNECYFMGCEHCPMFVSNEEELQWQHPSEL
jgi:hypothetical protein